MDDLGGKWGEKSPGEPQHADSSLLFTGWNFAMRWSRIDQGGARSGVSLGHDGYPDSRDSFPLAVDAHLRMTLSGDRVNH